MISATLQHDVGYLYSVWEGAVKMNPNKQQTQKHRKYRLNFNMFIISSLLYLHKIHYSYIFMVLSQKAAVSR